MRQITTEITIEADVATVWNKLTDFEHYPEWNPFITSIKGEKAAGKQLSITIKPPESKSMTFKPVIVEWIPYQALRWKGKLGVKGIFDGEHFFILKMVGSNQTTFTHGETFTGILIPFMSKTLDKTEEGFKLMNTSLKRACEEP